MILTFEVSMDGTKMRVTRCHHVEVMINESPARRDDEGQLYATASTCPRITGRNVLMDMTSGLDSSSFQIV
ncbi:hypothetical protein RvY_05688 [Ramazzottius varieornatus]|uniref:Uncharacterized protein n=1 Tax=Ramazzottius varieornatus TaxID=947166 RepID=A0A1D1UZI0_RAMVA|nr:hypothetical protein RvY_05688 [Ramazzottius varieornatus]